MKIMKFSPKKNKAQAMVEFAIVLPILLLVVYGLIETGRLIFVVASVNNASRQAVRYGSTSGVGPNGVPRYQDCAGMRAAAQNSDFLNVFDDADITITYDNPDGTITYDGTCNGNTDTTVTPSTGHRVNVEIDAGFSAIFPKFLPFLTRTITSASSRTLLLTINIAPPGEPTTTLITSHTPSPSQIGQFVSVTVTVSAATTTPTGTVEVSGADENCTITLSGGTGSCSVKFLSAGTKTITALYTGDADHDGSSDSKTHIVEKAPTVTTITSDAPDPSLANQTFTVNVTVTSTLGTPTGTVTVDACAAPITLSGGTGSCSATFTSTGRKTITASYSGDTDHAASSDTERHDVILPNESVTIITAHSPDPSELGQSVTIVVFVGGITPPTGTVDITGASTNCSITLNNGIGSCTVVFTSLGAKTITATYNGDAGHQGSSDGVSHSVELAPTTTTITSATPNPSDIGVPVLVTVTVTGGSTTPTGTVNITGADTNCTITLSGGTGNCSVVFNSSGSKTLTATYSGDTTHAASNDTESHTVAMPPVTGCNTVTAGLLQQTGGALTMTINNPLSVPLQIGSVTLTWNHDKGHQTGDDKTLRLQFVNLNGSVFWSGNELGPTTNPIVPNPATTIPVGTSTITFTFHQIFDRWDNTEVVTINLSTPGCESYPIIQNQH